MHPICRVLSFGRFDSKKRSVKWVKLKGQSVMDSNEGQSAILNSPRGLGFVEVVKDRLPK